MGEDIGEKMDFIALTVLLWVGTFLVLADVNLYKQYRQGDTLLYGKATVAFAVILTVAYYASLFILAF